MIGAFSFACRDWRRGGFFKTERRISITKKMAQDNKHFNTYKEGLDLEFLREYCMEHGERRTFERGERLRVGELARE